MIRGFAQGAPPGPDEEAAPRGDTEKQPLSPHLDAKSTIDLKNISIFIDDSLTDEQYQVRDLTVSGEPVIEAEIGPIPFKVSKKV